MFSQDCVYVVQINLCAPLTTPKAESATSVTLKIISFAYFILMFMGRGNELCKTIEGIILKEEIVAFGQYQILNPDKFATFGLACTNTFKMYKGILST